MPPKRQAKNDENAGGKIASSQSEDQGIREASVTMLVASTAWGTRALQWTWLAGLCLLSLSYALAALYATQFDKEVRTLAGDRATTARIKDRLADFGHTYQVVAERNAEDGESRRRGALDGTIQELSLSACDALRIQPAQGPVRVASTILAYQRTIRPSIQSSHALEVGSDRAWLCQTRERVKEEFDRIQGTGSTGMVSFETIMRDFMSFEHLGFLVPLGPHPMTLATATQKELTLALVLSMAVFGSTLFMVRSLLKRRLEQPSRPAGAPSERPFSWFMLRPLLGLMTGFAVFFLLKAGQLTFGDPVASAARMDGGVNPYALGFVAFISGFLCWQALERIEQAGEKLFGCDKRKERWAPGLGRVLENAPKPSRRTPNRLAQQLDVSIEQVRRWADHQDKVPYPIQIRIAAWLDEDPARLFSDLRPESPQASSSEIERGRSYPRRILDSFLRRTHAPS